MELARSRHRLIRLLASSAIAVVLGLAVWRAPANRPLIAPPDALDVQEPALRGEAIARPAATAAAKSALPEGATMAIGQLVLYTSAGSYSPDQLRTMAPQLAEALEYVEERTGMQLAEPVAVMFERRDSCGVDGAAYTERRTIVLYACADLPGRRAVNILAHEYVHQLAHDRFGEAHLRADLALSEGLATWGAGKYWLGEEAHFRGFVQRHYAGALLPLGSHYSDYGTIDAMNRLYYEWAALVEYIKQTHGGDVFERLYASGSGAHPNSADYAGVLGVDLAGLESEWQAWLTVSRIE